MQLRFGGSDPVGGPVVVEFEVVADQVRCWAGDAVVLLDRDVLAGWLAAPGSVLARDGVTFEPAQWGVVFSFAGRVQRTVIKPADITGLASLVSPDGFAAAGSGDSVHTVDTAASPAATLTGSGAGRAR